MSLFVRLRDTGGDPIDFLAAIKQSVDKAEWTRLMEEKHQNRTVFEWCCSAGMAEAAIALIEWGVDPGPIPARSGSSAVHFAAIGGSIPLLRALVADGRLAVDHQNDSGVTPFLLACHNGKLEAAKFLVEAGADMTHRDRIDGNGAAHHAACCGQSAVLAWLADQPSINLHAVNNHRRSPLSLAAGSGNILALMTLVEAGIALQPPRPFVGIRQGETPWASAVIRDRPETLDWLLQHGYPLDARFECDPDGTSPMTLAMMCDSVGAAKFMHKMSVFGIRLVDVELCIRNRSINTFRWLMRSAGRVYGSAKRRLHEVAFKAARSRDPTGLLPFWDEMRARPGFDINTRDDRNNTFLMMIAAIGPIEMVDWMLKHGANVEMRNWRGLSAVDMASVRNRVPVMNRLLWSTRAPLSMIVHSPQNSVSPLTRAIQRVDARAYCLFLSFGVEVPPEARPSRGVLGWLDKLAHGPSPRSSAFFLLLMNNAQPVHVMMLRGMPLPAPISAAERELLAPDDAIAASTVHYLDIDGVRSAAAVARLSRKRWTPRRHWLLPTAARALIKLMLMVALRQQRGSRSRSPYRLPIELWFAIFEQLPVSAGAGKLDPNHPGDMTRRIAHWNRLKQVAGGAMKGQTFVI